MEDVIKSQQKDRKAEEVDVLYLDNVKSSAISGLTSEYSQLWKLSMANDGLTSIDGLPVLPKLEWLQLSDNKLTNGLDTLPDKCPNLKTLNLAGNRIATLKDLKPLSQLNNLSSLDLFNCPVTKVEDYRTHMFEMLPSLNVLDGLNKEGEEVEEESEGEEEEEEEEEEAEEESDDDEGDDEPGLDYLNKELGSGSSDDEEDYDPDQDEAGDQEDDDIDPSEDADDDGAGPSASKRPKLDTGSPPPAPASDSDSD